MLAGGVWGVVGVVYDKGGVGEMGWELRGRLGSGG